MFEKTRDSRVVTSFYTVEIEIRTRRDLSMDRTPQDLRDDSGQMQYVCGGYEKSRAIPAGVYTVPPPSGAARLAVRLSPSLSRRIYDAQFKKALAQRRPAVQTQSYLFAFERFKTPPKRISFSFSGHYDPDPSDVVSVTFRDVPISK